VRRGGGKILGGLPSSFYFLSWLWLQFFISQHSPRSDELKQWNHIPAQEDGRVGSIAAGGRAGLVSAAQDPEDNARAA
jgi:hypothetical protein